MNYVIIFAAILPAILMLVYIYCKDRLQHEPLNWMLKGVGYGVLSAFLAIFLASAITILGLTFAQPSNAFQSVWNAFFSAAIPEEAAKLLMLWLLLRKNPYFDERFDGIVYACCIGMGFAGFENILYLFDNLEQWQSVAFSRAIFAVPGHFLFAVSMGYYYSMAYFRDMNDWSRWRIYWIPVLLHGIYDGLLFVADLGHAQGLLLMMFYVFCFLMYKGGKRKIAQRVQADEEDLAAAREEHQEIHIKFF